MTNRSVTELLHRLDTEHDPMATVIRRFNRYELDVLHRQIQPVDNVVRYTSDIPRNQVPAVDKYTGYGTSNPQPNGQTIHSMDWHTRAACKGLTPDLFFPSVGGNKPSTDAIRVCATCPVRTECLNEALKCPPMDDYGVWGGTTVTQRQQIRRAKEAA